MCIFGRVTWQRAEPVDTEIFCLFIRLCLEVRRNEKHSRTHIHTDVACLQNNYQINFGAHCERILCQLVRLYRLRRPFVKAKVEMTRFTHTRRWNLIRPVPIWPLSLSARLKINRKDSTLKKGKNCEQRKYCAEEQMNKPGFEVTEKQPSATLTVLPRPPVAFDGEF